MSATLPDILHPFHLSPPQRQAALARGSDVAVTAGAGTGKTRTLVARYLSLLADGLPLRQIVAVTFTRKAAREMRNRVREEINRYVLQADLEPAVRARWQAYYHELDAARIGTIHNLCGEILRAHPAEAGIDPRFVVLDETQAALQLAEAVEAALAWAVSAPEMTDLFTLLRERPLQALLVTLLQNRLAAQAICATIPAEGVLAHWQKLLQQAQAEMLTRWLADPDTQAAVHLLRTNAASNPQDLAEAQRLAAVAALALPDDAPLAERLRRVAGLGTIVLRGGSQKSWPGGKEQLADVKAALSCLREGYRERPLLAARLNDQDSVLAGVMPAIYTLFHTARHLYQAQKAEREALDFDDLEAQASRLLAEDTAVRTYWQEQTAALLVDEFQDTNDHQRHFLRLLCPDPGKLFIVGDAKQSIYRFRGADVTVFHGEKARIRQSGGQLIDLDVSYRAHDALLTGMNRLLQPVLGEAGPHRPPWAAPFVPLQPGTKGMKAGFQPPFVEFHVAAGTKAAAMPVAAAALAARLQQLHAAGCADYGQMAILCRASAAFHYYENALDAAGVPYVTVAGKGFYDRPEIRDLLNALRAIDDPHDDVALVGLLRSPVCGVSDVGLYRLAVGRPPGVSLWSRLLADEVRLDGVEQSRLETAVALIADLHRQAGRVPVADIFKSFMDRTAYRAVLRRVGLPRALRNVAKLLADIHSSELVSVNDFLEFAGAIRDSGSREGEARTAAGGAVQIMSIHAAKGLEFPVVVLGDAGSTPPRRQQVLLDPALGILLPAKSEADEQAAVYLLAAERAKAQEDAEASRLLYVALTRAEQMVLVNGVGEQTQKGLSWKGWLGQLVEIAGLTAVAGAEYVETGSEVHLFEGEMGDTAVRLALYEPGAVLPVGATAPIPAAATSVVETADSGLQAPLPVWALPSAAALETPPRVWQVVATARRPEAPAWVIGSLVHAALALWRFPGPGFDAWLAARARHFGLTDGPQLHHAHQETVRMLQQFQSHGLYRRIVAAEQRRHELPYSYRHGDRLQSGYIDLMFQHAAGWTIVDFKTDRVGSVAVVPGWLETTDYVSQLQQYGTAVSRLAGIRPELLLCLLNVAGGVHVESVTPAREKQA